MNPFLVALKHLGCLAAHVLEQAITDPQVDQALLALAASIVAKQQAVSR